MNLLEKVLAIMAVFGFIGIIVNALRGAEPSDIRNHIYSTFLILPLVLYGLGYIVYIIIKS